MTWWQIVLAVYGGSWVLALTVWLVARRLGICPPSLRGAEANLHRMWRDREWGRWTYILVPLEWIIYLCVFSLAVCMREKKAE